ncbi:ABC-2 type transport system permease protein [Streptomyces sp. V4I23]|uniref:ABC transporter permease n=1 Tax=Streptomyces sp. V4I23 TaxID=3042282 RepID=UPI00277F299E|nr:ABC transporter permease [Streptomyces sp. V4I23]MDQ1008521.1 ABC-2 type transport system permease protein [Streptomyces sp. V4I23]
MSPTTRTRPAEYARPAGSAPAAAPGPTAPVSPLRNTLREGLRRGGRELHQMATTRQDLISNLVWLVGLLAPLHMLRDNELAGTGMSVAGFLLPSLMSMCVAFNGMLGLTQQLIVERQDGTLLRLKALPSGMPSYLVGKLVAVSGTVLFACAVVTLTGIVMLPDVSASDPGVWTALAWVLPLGLLAMLPVGAILGSLIESPRNLGLVMLPLFGLASVSGIFYPASHLPVWLQHVAEVFPLYWLGLAARAALLPDSAVTAEIGDSWRHWETVGVLGAWAVVGLLVAPMVLRRMARRESGSVMASRREHAMKRPV